MAALWFSIFAALLLQVSSYGYGFNPQDAYNSYQTLSQNTELPIDCPFHKEPISLKHPEDTIKGTINQEGNYAFDKIPGNIYSNVNHLDAINPYQQQSNQQYQPQYNQQFPQSPSYNQYQSQNQIYPFVDYNGYQNQYNNGYQPDYTGYPSQNFNGQNNGYWEPNYSYQDINNNFYVPEENFVSPDQEFPTPFCGTGAGPETGEEQFSILPYLGHDQEVFQPDENFVPPMIEENCDDEEEQYSIMPYFGNNQQYGKPFYGYDEPSENDLTRDDEDHISEQENDPKETRQLIDRAISNIEAIYEGANEELEESKLNTQSKSQSARGIIEKLGNQGTSASFESFTQRGLFSSFMPSMAKNILSQAKAVSSGMTQLAVAPLTGISSALKKEAERNVAKVEEPNKTTSLRPTKTEKINPAKKVVLGTSKSPIATNAVKKETILSSKIKPAIKERNEIVQKVKAPIVVVKDEIKTVEPEEKIQAIGVVNTAEDEIPTADEQKIVKLEDKMEILNVQNAAIDEVPAAVEEEPVEPEQKIQTLDVNKAVAETPAAAEQSLSIVNEAADEIIDAEKKIRDIEEATAQPSDDGIMKILPFFPLTENTNSLPITTRSAASDSLPGFNFDEANGDLEEYETSESACAAEASRVFSTKKEENINDALSCINAADVNRDQQMQKIHVALNEAYEAAKDQNSINGELLNMCAYSQFALCEEERNTLQETVTNFATKSNDELAQATAGEDEHAAAVNSCVAKATAAHNLLQLQQSDSRQICQENDEE